jgi:hypothetical protein
VTICVFCESEAELAIDGNPVCEACSRKPGIDFGEPRTDRQIRAALHREIVASTARAHGASEALIAIMREIPSGLPHPDGSQRIQSAARALAAARNEVMNAHARLNDFLARSGTSRDWKPGGPA